MNEKIKKIKGKSKKVVYETFKNIVYESAFAKYGEAIDEAIKKRIDEELDFFYKNKLFKKIIDLSINIHKNELIVPRLSLGNSLVLFLLGFTNVNPLKRHTYCPKCHKFYWGKKKSKVCDYCSTELIEDGYNLPFETLKNDLKKESYRFQFSTSLLTKREDVNFKFWPNNDLRLAHKLGLKMSDLSKVPDNVDEIIRCLDKEYFSKHYKWNNIFDHQAFVGIYDLSSKICAEYFNKFKVKTLDDLIKILSILHGTNTVHSNFKYMGNDLSKFITSRDELYLLLRDFQLNEYDALQVCNEVRLRCDGHLSKLSEAKLYEAGVDAKYINFMKDIRYIFYKARIVSHLLVELNLAKIYLEEPKRYYEAYLKLIKKDVDKDKISGDCIKDYVKNKETGLDNYCLALLEIKERL